MINGVYILSLIAGLRPVSGEVPGEAHQVCVVLGASDVRTECDGDVGHPQ